MIIQGDTFIAVSNPNHILAAMCTREPGSPFLEPNTYYIRIRCNASGEVRYVVMPCEWDEGQLFYLTEGNYSCDTNRHLEFQRAGGLTGEDVNWELEGKGHVCNEGYYTILDATLPNGTIVKVDEDQLLEGDTKPPQVSLINVPRIDISQIKDIAYKKALEESTPKRDAGSKRGIGWAAEALPHLVRLEQTTFQQELVLTNTVIEFSKYPDNTLRLYKPDSLISDTPAGYSEEKVSVKIIVKRPAEEFMVVIKTTRRELDLPGAEDRLAMAAYEWRK